jgi:DNA-binding NarL/FixJ family response regulator
MNSSAPSQPAASPSRHKLALVEDLPEMRAHWTQLLGSFPEFECVCACASGEEALRMLPQANPDLVLMDIFLPRMSGIECTARLRELLPQVQILMLTASDNEDLVFPAFEAGASGYLAKQIRSTDLHAALLDAVKGGVPMTSGIARRVVAYFRDRAQKRSETTPLSPREQEVLMLLSKGYSNKEIAGKLGLGLETVQSYLKQIYRKMHVHSRSEAIIKYLSAENTQP